MIKFNLEDYDENELSQEQRDILEKINDEVYVIDEIIDNGRKEYLAHIDTIYDYVKAGFEKKQFREFPVKFKFHSDDSRVYVLQLRHYLTNLMFWCPIVRLKMEEDMNYEHIVDCAKISTGYIKWYIDEKIIIPYRSCFSNKKINMVIADMLYRLGTISNDFTLLLGLTINLETFMDVADRIPRFNEILHMKLDPDMQPNEIEELLDEIEKEEIDILMNDPEGNLIQPILRSGSGIKTKQLRELTAVGGLKPDLYGNTMPVPITSNFLIGGLGSIPNYYIDAAAARKAVIMNKTAMGTSGHFARKVMLISTDVKLRKDELECNTVNFVTYEIKTKDHLRRLRGRNMITSPTTMVMLKGDEDYLIGHKIHVYSPATCASREGVCKKCYGGLFYTNRDLWSVGALAGAKTTNPMSQDILSTKHLLTTISERIDFNDEFYKFFSLISNEIIINNDTDDDININDYILCINSEDIEAVEEFDETEYNHYVMQFYIKKKKSSEMIRIYEINGKEIYLSPAIDAGLKSGRKNGDFIEIPFSILDDDEKLFSVIILNNELTKPLYEIMHVLDRKGNLGCNTISEICQKMLDLFITSHINLDAVHAELLIKPLIRDRRNILKYPKFNTWKDEKDYQLLTVSAALEKNPSVLISLSFQALARQLSNPLTYKKEGTSFLDPLFKERL